MLQLLELLDLLELQGNSMSKSKCKWTSTAGFRDALTGEQISRAKAVAEVSKMQNESPSRVSKNESDQRQMCVKIN